MIEDLFFQPTFTNLFSFGNQLGTLYFISLLVYMLQNAVKAREPLNVYLRV